MNLVDWSSHSILLQSTMNNQQRISERTSRNSNAVFLRRLTVCGANRCCHPLAVVTPLQLVLHRLSGLVQAPALHLRGADAILNGGQERPIVRHEREITERPVARDDAPGTEAVEEIEVR